MKRIIKFLLTFIYHPIISLLFYFKGSRKIVIGKRAKFNTLKNITLKSNIQIGTDARFLLIREYYGARYNPNLFIGENVVIGNRCTFLVATDLIIEEDCLIASDVLFTTESHGIDPVNYDSYNKQPLTAKSIIIRNGCWIGEKVSILPGVEIGEKSIIATNGGCYQILSPF